MSAEMELDAAVRAADDACSRGVVSSAPAGPSAEPALELEAASAATPGAFSRAVVSASASVPALRAAVLGLAPGLSEATVKLISAGGGAPAWLHDDAALRALLARAAAPPLRVRVLGSRASEAEAWAAAQARAAAASARVRDDAGAASGLLPGPRAAEFVSARFAAHARAMAAAPPQARWGFGAVRPLAAPGLPERARAREALEFFATHPGVLAVMKSRAWFVPVLAEMYPEGAVNVDPVCVLGLNVNKGAEIQLRLRTDDLQGWRKTAVVFKTLYHELAHNEISEHTGAFYTLVSALTREGEAADWTASEGHRVDGGRAALAAAAWRGDERVEIAPHTASGARAEGGGGRVGGDHVAGGAAAAARARAAAAVEAAAAEAAAAEAAAAAAALAASSASTANDTCVAPVAVDAAASRAAAAPAAELQAACGDAAATADVAVAAAAAASATPAAADVDVAAAAAALSDALSMVVGACLVRGVPVRGALGMLLEIVARAEAALEEASAAGGAAAASAKGLRLRPASAALAQRTGGGAEVRALLIEAGFAAAARAAAGEEEVLVAGAASRAALARARGALAGAIAAL